MAFIGDIDTNNVPANPFDPIPAGEYICIITDSVDTPTKAGTGSYINLTLQVIEGEFSNRKVFDKLNLHNPSEKAVNIARSSLAAIKAATGQVAAQDTTEFHDIPIRVKVAVEKDTYNGTEKLDNVVKGYYPVTGPVSAPAPRAAAPAAQKPAAPVATGKPSAPPWANKAA